MAETIFGTVTSDRVIYFRKKGWFRGGSREDVPLRHVTSVRIEKTRHIVWAIILILLGLVAVRPESYYTGVIPLAIGILLLWGSPTVIINTAGGDLSAMKGWPWQTKYAEEFVEAVRKQLFRERKE